MCSIHIGGTKKWRSMPERKAKDESFSSTKELVDFINKRRIQKEDLICVTHIDGWWFLIYFG